MLDIQEDRIRLCIFEIFTKLFSTKWWKT